MRPRERSPTGSTTASCIVRERPHATQQGATQRVAVIFIRLGDLGLLPPPGTAFRLQGGELHVDENPGNGYTSKGFQRIREAILSAGAPDRAFFRRRVLKYVSSHGAIHPGGEPLPDKAVPRPRGADFRPVCEAEKCRTLRQTSQPSLAVWGSKC